MSIINAVAANGRFHVSVDRDGPWQWLVTVRPVGDIEFDETDADIFGHVAAMPECLDTKDRLIWFDLAELIAGGEMEARRLAFALLTEGASAHQRVEAVIDCGL
ncbi:hypothetical protein [Paramagnetospirillum marisnigri]|nr:hypothetical protein [Paramagnetospirillum marisnigri]